MPGYKNEGYDVWGDEDFKVELNKNIKPYGDTNYRDMTIRLNPKRGDLVNTIIHENLHAKHPEMPHDQVYKNADKLESKMDIPEMIGLLAQTHERISNPPRRMEMEQTYATKVVKQKID